jgi:hypothetical protein
VCSPIQVFKENKFRFFATKEAIKKIMYGSLLNRPNDAAPIDKKEVRYVHLPCLLY